MNIKRGVARTAFFHGRQRPSTPALSAGDLPKIQAVCRSVACAQQAHGESSSIGDKPLYINYSE
jgi:hypothetical protein